MVSDSSNDKEAVTLILDRNELRIVGNALNEVCNGVDIDDFEFSARIGAGREEARILLKKVHALRGRSG